MTITAKSFYESSKDAFYLTQRNNNLYFPIQGLGDTIIITGQLFIILASTILAFFLFLEVLGEDFIISLYSTIVIFFKTKSSFF